MPLRRFPGLRALCLLGLLALGSGSRAEPGLRGPDLSEPEALDRVRQAVAWERAGDTAAARGTYLAQIASLPAIADWLRLRAAALTPDSQARHLFYRDIETESVRSRLALAEAEILERLGDTRGAGAARLALGDTAEAVRLQVLTADSAERREVLHQGVVLLQRSSPGAAQRLSATLAGHTQRLSAQDRILAARAAARAGAAGPAAQLFLAARQAGITLGSEDQLAWGRALFATGEYTGAARELERVQAPSLRRVADAERGRALVRAGKTTEGRQVLERLVARAPSDSAASPAWLLLADLKRDQHDYQGARRLWLRAAEAAPASPGAARARFLAAMVLWYDGQYPAAAAEFDAIGTTLPESDEAVAAAYWAGRSWNKAGQSQRATQLWEGIVRGSPLSYYAGLARRQLGREAAGLASRYDSLPAFADLDSAERRLDLLARSGLVPEISWEQRWLLAQAGDDPARVLATGQLLVATGATWPAAQLGWRAWRLSGPDRSVARVIFPVRYHDPLTTAARRSDLEPALVAALIRQESVFDSSAVSRAGARGLMQLMPTVGRELGRSRGVSPWHPDSLFDPARNLDLGSAHLAHVLNAHTGLPYALAAYNAGSSRVHRWIKAPGTDDPELFVEWIPFTETRGYVKAVMRNLEVYRALYAWN